LNARDLSENQLTKKLDYLIKELNLVEVGRELRLGAFRFDAIAYDQAGTIVVVELKVMATKDTLAQLLLYPHAIRKFLKRSGIENQKVRSVLITTHIDLNVVEITERLSDIEDVSIKICIGTDDNLQLVDPEHSPDQMWDQSLKRGICDFRLVDRKLQTR
jgi:RecB family endonuclease NucS